jgi:peroxiredoxin
MNGKSLLRIVIPLLMLTILMAGGGCSREDEPSRGMKAEKKALPSAERSRTPVAQRGKAAPDFELQDLDGNIRKLSDLKGQVVFVNFWATWCPPCREEMPSMQDLYETMPGDRFKMLTILSNDNPALAATFAEKNGFSFPILVDPGSEVANAYGLTGVPETYIVDKQGILRQQYLGPRQWNSPKAQQMLKAYMDQ